MVGCAAHGSVRHRTIDQALRGRPTAARRGPLPRRRQPARPDARGDRALDPRPRPHPRHRGRRGPARARSRGRLHRRRRGARRSRHHEDDAQAHATGRLAHVCPARTGAWRWTARATWATRWRSSSPRPRLKRRTPPTWCEWTTSPCPPSPTPAWRPRPAVPRCGTSAPTTSPTCTRSGDRAATEAAFAQAAHRVRRRYVITRVHAQYMEPRGALGVYDPGEDRYTLHADVQYPHRVRTALATNIFKIPEHQIRVIAGDVGGAFGTKGWQYAEHRLVLWAARKVKPAGEVAVRAARGHPGRRARARQRERGRAGPRRPGSLPRPAGAHLRQRGRLRLVRPQSARHLQQRRDAGRRLRVPGRARRGPLACSPTPTRPRRIAARDGPRPPTSSSG